MRNSIISAIVLAAGLSTRMGRPKMVLPWGASTVIGQVVNTLLLAGVKEVVVVTGAARVEVEDVVKQVNRAEVRTAFNPRYAEDNMLISLQVGMASLGEDVDAMLVVLGDQPQIEIDVVRSLMKVYQAENARLIVPSFDMRRGHPWVVDRSLWPALQSIPDGATMRDFLHAHPQQITYLPVNSSSILRDLDTPEEYALATQIPETSARDEQTREK
jgi:molybdenum cofactor cytidylyltransferase